MNEIICEKCGNKEKVELHHIIPKSIGGNSYDGRIYLCKKCHDILHKSLLNVVWNWLPEKYKSECKFELKNYTAWFIKQNGNTNTD